MQNAYIIRGSEDGILAIASSPAKAVAIAEAYVTQAPAGARAVWDGCCVNMAMATAALRKHDTFLIEITNCPPGYLSCAEMLTAEIEKFDVNGYRGQYW